MIIGRDLRKELGIHLDFENDIVEWDNSYIDIKDMDITVEELYTMDEKSEPENLKKATQKIKNILDTK